jgi:hypothetical protein
MLDYAEFEIDEEGIFIFYMCPSLPYLDNDGTVIEGEHALSKTRSWCQIFNVNDYSSRESLFKYYARMIRCGRHRYLNAYWLSHEDTNDKGDWMCDRCENEPESPYVIPYGCDCSSWIDVCPSCYEKDNKCPKCNKPLKDGL